MNRKIVIAVIVVAVIIVGAVIYLRTSPTLLGPAEIQWWHAMGGALGEKVEEIAAGFNESQSDYKLVAVNKGNYTETMTAGIAAFRAGKPPPHHAGVRGWHRDDDGSQGRRQAGVPTDGRSR